MSDFLNNPTKENCEKLPRYLLSLINGWCLYSIDNKVGDVKKAKKIRNIIYPFLTKDICFDRRGLKSLFSVLKLLINLNKPVYKLIIYINNEEAITIQYNYDDNLPGMFFIVQEYTPLGVDKELFLYFENTKEYFLDIFKDNLDFKITLIKMVINKNEKMVYDHRLGIIWNMEECAKCTIAKLNGEELSQRCIHLTDKECYNKFRNKPEFVFKLGQNKETKKGVEKYINLNKWKCEECLLLNDNDKSKCIACDTERKK